MDMESRICTDSVVIVDEAYIDFAGKSALELIEIGRASCRERV